MPQFDSRINKPHPRYYALQQNPELDRLITYVWNFSIDYEQWREIPHTNGLYYISNRARVLSLNRDGYRILKPFICGNGYYCVSIPIDGEWREVRIHILVAEAFIANPERKPIVHHIDGRKTNNDVSNLVWLTTAEHGKAHAILNQQAGTDEALLFAV